MKTVLTIIICLLTFGVKGQSKLDNFLKDVPVIELPFSISYLSLDTINLARLIQVDDKDLTELMGDFRTIKFEDDWVSQYRILGKVSYGVDTTAFLLISDSYSKDKKNSIRIVSFFYPRSFSIYRKLSIFL